VVRARSSDVGCICDCHHGPGDSQTDWWPRVTYVVITARGQPIKEIRQASGETVQKSPRDEFIRYIKIAHKDIKLVVEETTAENHFYHTAALRGMAPCRFSDPISRTIASGVIPFHTRHAARTRSAGLNIKELKIPGKAEGTTDPSLSL
jgi:hypothetical protein